MRLPLRFSFYIGKQFLLSLGITLAAFTVIILLVDFMELLRRAHGRDAPAFILFQMALLRYPLMVQKMGAFVMLLAAVFCLTRLTRSYELVVARAAGISVWQFMVPPVTLAFAIGVLFITALNPLGCTMLSRYEFLEGKYLHGRTSLLAVSSSGLWLRQRNLSDANGEKNGETVIHALRTGTGEDIELFDVTIFVYGAQDKFLRRIDAKEAKLVTDFWRLNDVMVTTREVIGQPQNEYFLETDLTFEQIHDSLASPESISFWELPGFISTLQDAGFSALRHRLYWHTTLVSPLFFAAMVLIGAVFSLSPPRKGKSGLLITASILTGFLLYFLTSLVSTFGLSGSMPVTLSAWIPVIISLLIGTVSLLHFEDG